MACTENDSDDDLPLAKVAKRMSVDEDTRHTLDRHISEECNIPTQPHEHIKKTNHFPQEEEEENETLNFQKIELSLNSKFDIYFEYEWPPNRSTCFYVIEYFLAKYLNIDISDERLKDVDKRSISSEEKQFLHEKGVVDEIVCVEDIKVILCEDACQFMAEYFPKEFMVYLNVLRKNEMKKLNQKQVSQRAIASKLKVPSFVKRALKETVRYNSRLNNERKEERQAYFDLQTQIIHLPQKKRCYDPNAIPKRSEYPVALMPGQYQDYYKKYTEEELAGFPLKSITRATWKKKQIITPEKENATANDEQPKEVEKKDDDTSNVEIQADKDPFCGICMKGPETNKFGVEEKLIHCSQCENSGHPSCLDMNRNLVTVISSYPWQCMECKVCTECLAPHDEESMMFCDHCDRGYHSYCVGLKEIPKGRWVCMRCGKCASCLSLEPVAKGETGRWKNELSKPTDGNEAEFLQIHCHQCSKFFRKGNFCPVCLKAYGNDEDLASPMICCDKCDRWIHTDCDAIDETRINELSKNQKTPYTCILCRGEKEERMDSFHRKNR